MSSILQSRVFRLNKKAALHIGETIGRAVLVYCIFPRKRRSREIQRQSIIGASSGHLPDFQQDEKIEHLFYKRQARHISSYGIGWELEGIENGFRLTEGIAFLLSRGKDKGLGSDDIAAHLVETSETDIRSAHSLAVADFP